MSWLEDKSCRPENQGTILEDDCSFGSPTIISIAMWRYFARIAHEAGLHASGRSFARGAREMAMRQLDASRGSAARWREENRRRILEAFDAPVTEEYLRANLIDPLGREHPEVRQALDRLLKEKATDPQSPQSPKRGIFVPARL
jgi:hypothetical protein